MEFVKEIGVQIESIDEVFESLGKPPLMKNADFAIGEMTTEWYLDVQYTAGLGVPVRIILSYSEIRIDVDRAEEAFHIDPVKYKDNWSEFRELIEIIFTSTIEVEHCGKHYTKIDFFNNENERVETVKHSTSFFARKLDCSTIRYPPIYERRTF